MSRAEAAAFPAPWRAGRGSGRAGGRAGEPRPLRPEPPEPPRPSPALGCLRGHSLSCVSSGPRPRGLACPGLLPEQSGQRSPCGCGDRTSRVGIRERARCRVSVGQPGREEEGCAGLRWRWRWRRRLQQLQQSCCCSLPLIRAHPERLVDGERVGRDASRAWLGFIFRKKGKRQSGKGALRRRCKGWELCLEKRRGCADTDWKSLRKLIFENNFSILFFS